MRSSGGPRTEAGSRRDDWYDRLTHGAPLAVLLVILALIAYKLIPVLELVAIAALIALVLRTFVTSLEKLGVKPWVSAILLLVILGSLVGFLWLFIVPRVAGELQSLVNSNAKGSLGSLTALSQRLHESTSFFPDISSLSGRLKSYVDQEIGSLPGLLAKVGHIGIDMIAVLFLTVYLSISPGSLVNSGLRLVPREKRDEIKEVIQCLKIRLRGWIAGTGIAMAVIGTAVGTGLWFIGVPLPITFGILAGLLELVPYVGQIVAALLPALVALTISPYHSLLVIVLFIVVDQLDAHVIQPLVMGSQVNLHPVVVLVSFIALGSLLGLAGVVLAVPLAVFVAVLLDETILKNEDSTEKREAEEQRQEEEPVRQGSPT